MAVPRPAVLAGLVAGLLGLMAVSALAQTAAPPDNELSELQTHRFSGPPERPRRHLRISNPATLSPQESEAIYADLREALAGRYAASGDATARAYQTWTRHNTVPFTSATHGRRFVNVYANDVAADYGKASLDAPLPAGAVIAKDSFVVTAGGKITLGPLFVMEKMPDGFNYLTGDWRYTVVTKDGEVAGRTLGSAAKRVEFCIACHLAREEQDHLFFVPPDFRRAP